MIQHVVLKKEMVIQERNSVNLTYLTMSKDPDLTMRVELHVLHARIQKILLEGVQLQRFLARLHGVQRAIVVTIVVRIPVPFPSPWVKVFKSIS